MQIIVENGGVRLDAYVTDHVDISRAQVLRHIKSGAVQLNGNVVKAGTILRDGDIITVDIPEEQCSATPEQIDLDIVFEDEHLLVLNKPRGMVVQPGNGVRSGTLLNALLGRYRDAGGLTRGGIVHRLDRNTCGLMVVAKTLATQAKLGAMIEAREVTRIYTGLVEGRIAQPGQISTNIERCSQRRTLYTTVCISKRGGHCRTALTYYTPLQYFTHPTSRKPYSLVQFKLETGRTHQIRVHAKSIGHPLVGDPDYNPSSSIKLGYQLLEATQLGFTHPITGQALNFEIPPSQAMSDVIAKLSRTEL